MEKAVLKTLIYGNIFDYPMKAWEIHKWLIGKKATLRQVEKALQKLYQVSSIKYQHGYYFLAGRKGLARKRLTRQRQSQKFFKTANLAAKLIKLIPWIKLVGMSGGLAMENADKKDDIDLFIVTGENRLWLARLGMLGVLGMLGKRRKREDTVKTAAGKICINLLVDKDSLVQKSKDIYLAHEVLQMRVLWERDGLYSKFLEENSWALRYLPNWATTQLIDQRLKIKDKKDGSSTKIFSSTLRSNILDFLEKIAHFFQMRYMGKPSGKEKISKSALYFHPEDKRGWVLENYTKKLTSLGGNGRSR